MIFPNSISNRFLLSVFVIQENTCLLSTMQQWVLQKKKKKNVSRGEEKEREEEKSGDSRA